MAFAYRHVVGSPPKYRRSTLDIYHSLETGQHTPTTSVLDRKWVHRSLGDLTSENDLHLSHPRLTSKFYQDLYKKYPRAFHRRREARDAGRKLFNPKNHVRFEDEILDDMSVKSSRSERPTTNWDREVSQYKNLGSRSRDCFTSAEPSETGSVLSVKERLHLNSKTLNRLLNEKSPLRKKFSEANRSQYDSGTENENSGREPCLSNRTRLRFRHKRVLQRKVDNTQNGAIDHIGEIRKPTSLSGEYVRRARTVPPTSGKHRHVDVESLIANADLEINTLLEKINMKMSSPDSPPDSAIDVDTPSVRSLFSTEKGSSSDLPLSVVQEPIILQDCDALTKSSDYRTEAEVYSIDVYNVSDETEHMTGVENHDPLQDPDNILLLKEYGVDFNDTHLVRDIEKDRTDADNQVISGHNFTSGKENRSDYLTNGIDIYTKANHDIIMQSSCDIPKSGEGQGLLQLCVDKSTLPYKTEDKLSEDRESTYTSVFSEYSKTDLIKRANENFEAHNESELIKKASALVESEMKDGQDSAQSETLLKDLNQDKNYQADDEAEANDDEVSLKIQSVEARNKMTLHKDSDVDSGIGQSGTETRSPLPVAPPRGRSRQRGAGTKTQPVKADHSILPDRSEVDTCILNEVNLTQFSNGHHTRGGSLSDEIDDTDPRREITTVTTEEQKLTEKYKRQRSPSPYILKGHRQSSPRFRAQSAPLYYSGNLDLQVVDISLSNESLSDISSNISTLNNVSLSGIDTFTSSKYIPCESVQNISSCQSNNQPSNSAQSCNNSKQLKVLTSNLANVQSCLDSNLSSSSPVQQRKSSSSTYSVTSVSSADTENTLVNVHMNPVLNAITDHNRNNVPNHTAQNNVNDTKSVHTDSTVAGTNLEVLQNHSLISEKHANVENIDETNSHETNNRTTNDGQPERSVDSEQNIDPEKNPDDNEIIIQKSNNTSNTAQTKAERKHSKDKVLNEKNESDCVEEDLQLHSAKKIDIVKPKLETQSSVDSKGSFESIELSDPELPHQGGISKEVRRIYKPSVNSPRVNENKTNMRNIFKHKKGRFSPGVENSIDQKYHNEIVLVGCDKINSEGLENRDTVQERKGSGTNGDVNNLIEDLEEMTDSGSHPTYSARPVMINSKVSNNVQNGSIDHDQHLARLKQNLRAELNLSKYKIKSDKREKDKTSDQKLEKLSQSSGSRWSQGSQISVDSMRSDDSLKSHDSPKSYDSPGSHGSAKSKNSSSSHGRRIQEPAIPMSKSVDQQNGEKKKSRSASDDGEIVVEDSNLRKSKELSASKGSLLDKMGGVKKATKGKFKAIRKAMSLERGIEQVGHDPEGQGVKQDGHKGNHSFFPKMKKAPSLKSITALFGRKKKKGKYAAEDAEASASGTTADGSADSSASLTNNKRKQWASCHTLSSIEVHQASQPVGRLLKMNPDGTQIVELTRPPKGPLGLFIAQGNPKYKQGIFVSRFNKEGPENVLSGLIGVGDEILEVNRHLVCDLSLDAVYKLMGASQTITLKIFPLMARKDL